MLFISAFLLSLCSCFGQSAALTKAAKQLQGTWLSQGDSICELLITADSITTFRFRANGVSGCSYILSSDPCVKVVKFPAATGVYMAQQCKGQTICCSISELTDSSLKIIYPNGTEMHYRIETGKK